MANEIRKGNGQVATAVLATLAVAAVTGLTGFASGAPEGALSVPDETIGKIGFRGWEYRAVTNDDVRTQAGGFKDAAQRCPTGKQKTFDSRR